MKKTEYDIYNYAKKEIENLILKRSTLKNIYDDMEIIEINAKIDAYEDIINYIGTVRTND